MRYLPEAMRPMAAYAQFILWRPEWDAAKGKWNKKPTCPITGLNTDHLNPASWMSFDVASKLAEKKNLGLGFIITKQDPFFVVDLDKVLVNGVWSPLAVELCNVFYGAAVEVSYSGTGLHIFGTGWWPEEHRCKDKNNPALEFYTEGRFVAITGTNAVGNCLQDCTQGIGYLLQKYLPERENIGSSAWTAEPHPDWRGPEDDDELIEKMLSSRSSAAAAFGTKASLKALWTGDEDALAKVYPSENGDVFDRSTADQALCTHLAFWTGKDCERIQRLFERSGIVRDKWRDRQKYREDTITNGVAICKAVYQQRQKAPTPAPAPYVADGEIPDGVIRDGFQFLGLPQQLEHFKGCVYVTDQHAIMTPGGKLLKSEQFKVHYGGYVFALDSIGDKCSKNAWEVFTESQAINFPRAYSQCFRPEHGPGEIIDEDGVKLVNVYFPINPRRVVGDPSPFLNHFAKILPDARDREILICYMATIVQHPGVKLRWTPFIQGTPGNGKSTISKIVSYAVGKRYSHSPRASGMAGQFNSFIQNKIFIAVEDVYTRDKQDVIEFLKPMISEEMIEVEPKGQNKYMADNRANWILNSNHKDGVTKVKDDRRFAIFFTAQQTKAQRLACGMDSRYFQYLRDWLETDGYAIMCEYLMNYPVAYEMDPRFMSDAPDTSATAEAVDLGLGIIEQNIIEAVEQHRPGFCGGWISSVALDRLLEQGRSSRYVPPNKRPDMLDSLGYQHHPHLRGGRASAPVAIDGCTRPRLYIKKDHLHLQLTNPAAIVDAYVKAQEIGAPLENASALFSKNGQ